MEYDLELYFKKLCVVLKEMEDKLYWNTREYSEYFCVDALSHEDRESLLKRIQEKSQYPQYISLKNNFLMIDEDTLTSFKGWAIIFEYSNN